MDKKALKLMDIILDELKGRMSYDQSIEKKKEIASGVLNNFYGDMDKSGLFGKSTRLKAQEKKEKFIEELFSFGFISDVLSNPELEDIVINTPDSIYIHHMREGLVKLDEKFSCPEELDIFLKKLLVFSGRTDLKKINDLELPFVKGRVNIVFSPFGHQVTITKIREKPMSIIELIRKESLDCLQAAWLWLCIEGLGSRPANILISGGPGAGKTTLLNALVSFIPKKERLVVIEDSLELDISDDRNCSRLESEVGLSMKDLVRNSLRMRPDRLMVGEVRGEEAQDMITAMNVGKYCMGTIHSSSAKEVLLRLIHRPMGVPEELLNLIDLLVMVKKMQFDGKIFRAVTEITETSRMAGKRPLLNHLWEFDYKQLKAKHVSEPSVFREKLVEATNFDAPQILKEIDRRVKLLKRIAEENIIELDDVSNICQDYIDNPEVVLAKFKI